MYKNLFSFPQNKIYLNCAMQGPLTNKAVAALNQSISDKLFPAHLDQSYGEARLSRARNAISKLIDCDVENIALANSTSWGINLLVQGLPLTTGDEVLMYSGQFPSNAAPWEIIREKGVEIRKIPTDSFIFETSAFEKALSPKTRVACLEWVHFVSGDRIPLKEIAELCRKKNILLIVDATQGIGAIPFSMKELGVDAVVCSAYKWLLSPYGSGFLAVTPKLLNILKPQMINWLSFKSMDFSSNLTGCSYELHPSARKFDTFALMGLLNLDGMTASIELLNEIGIKNIFEHGKKLVRLLKSRLHPEYYIPVNTGAEDRQSLIASFKTRGLDIECLAKKLQEKDIYVSVRQGCLRVSPHLYNSESDIEELAKLANQGISSTRSSTASV